MTRSANRPSVIWFLLALSACVAGALAFWRSPEQTGTVDPSRWAPDVFTRWASPAGDWPEGLEAGLADDAAVGFADGLANGMAFYTSAGEPVLHVNTEPSNLPEGWEKRSWRGGWLIGLPATLVLWSDHPGEMARHWHARKDGHVELLGTDSGWVSTFIPDAPYAPRTETYWPASGASRRVAILDDVVKMGASEEPDEGTATVAATESNGDIGLRMGRVQNHRTLEKMTITWVPPFVQAVDGDGKTVWQYELPAGRRPVNTVAFELDLYRNGKYQTAFSDDHGVYVVDVLGRLVSGFPMHFQQEITAFYVADYDRERRYRFLTATVDGSLSNHREEGERTPGWKFAESGESAIVALDHIRVGSKDYIYAGYENGDVRLLQRAGADRFETDVKVASGGTPAFRVGASIARSTVLFINEDGWVEEREFGSGEEAGMSRMMKGEAVRVEDVSGDGRPEVVVSWKDKVTYWNARNEEIQL